MNPDKKCPACRAPCIRSMCEYHLAKQAREWRAHTARRRALGQCVKCHRRGMVMKNGKRSVHCRVHQAVNASKCRAWGRENNSRLFEERKAKGICVGGNNHGPPVPGHIYCAGCRQRNNRWKRSQGIQVKVKPLAIAPWLVTSKPKPFAVGDRVKIRGVDHVVTSVGPVA